MRVFANVRREGGSLGGAIPAALLTALLSPLAFAEMAPAAGRGDAALGEYLSATCVACHQLSGQAVGGIPAIVGWPDDQFIAVMEAYRRKERDNPVMQTIAAGLSGEDIAALATFFGGLKPAAPNAR